MFRTQLVRHDLLRLFLRRLAKLAYWAVTFQLPLRFRQYRVNRVRALAVPGHVPPSQRVLTRAQAEAWNSAWYGSRPLSPKQRRTFLSLDASTIAHADLQHDQATALMATRYVGPYQRDDVETLRRIAPIKLIEGAFVAAQSSGIEQRGEMSYSIVTPFYKHIDHFRLCIRSVRELIKADIYAGHGQRIEWIIVNDDPLFREEQLQALFRDENLDGNVRLLSDGANAGIATRLNEACAAARSNWLLFLDCDDEIEANAVEILDDYIGKFPECRYISSGVCDIDDYGSILRWRRHGKPTKIFETGMTVGHLKAIRKDLIDDIGPFAVEHSGCQDYDFALRVALRESILCIPEYLYRYRWHDASQSVGSNVAQMTKTLHVLRDFMKLFADQMARGAIPACPRAAIDTAAEDRSVLDTNTRKSPRIVG